MSFSHGAASVEQIWCRSKLCPGAITTGAVSHSPLLTRFFPQIRHLQQVDSVITTDALSCNQLLTGEFFTKDSLTNPFAPTVQTSLICGSPRPDF